MTVFNLGSINADLVYRVPHLPGPGETLGATSFERYLGGKGTNMSVAAARAGAHVRHIGAVGPDGVWMVERLTEYGVDTRAIRVTETSSGHAIIAVDDHGENSILLFSGANHRIDEAALAAGLEDATEADIFLFQNETTGQVAGAELASSLGMRVAYAAAPFDATVVESVLPLLDLLILNAVEAQQLEEATGLAPEALPVRDVIVTLGADGARWHNTDLQETRHVPALPVEAVDTTGAGDTFTGYLIGVSRWSRPSRWPPRPRR